MCTWQLNETSIIVDAAKYIEELKQKVERLNGDIEAGQNSNHDDQNSWPAVILMTRILSLSQS